jgi:hypothetical protein
MSITAARLEAIGGTGGLAGVAAGWAGGPGGPAGHGIVAAAGELHDSLDAVMEAPAWSMTEQEQAATLVALTRAEARLAELRLRVLAAADVNGLGGASAASSTAAWLAVETGQTRPAAGADLRLARALDGEFEATRAALAAGRILTEQARVIVAAISDLPEDLPAELRRRGEALLISEAAGGLDARGLRAAGAHLFEVLDPEEADRREGEKLALAEAEARRRCYMRLRDNGDGSYTGRFKLPTVHGELLRKVLHALTSPRRLGEARRDGDGTPVRSDRLLGWGFMELIEHLPVDDLPNTGKNAVRLIVTIELDRLRSQLGAATLDTGGQISAAEARRLACAAGIIPVVLGGDSMPLDVGREDRFYREYQELAMIVRDKTCTTEGCDRPAWMCHKHHDNAWSEGGETNFDKGRLLCPWHHTHAHDRRYTMTRLPNNKVRFSRRT